MTKHIYQSLLKIFHYICHSFTLSIKPPCLPRSHIFIKPEHLAAAPSIMDTTLQPLHTGTIL